jgi:hypothetical protein
VNATDSGRTIGSTGQNADKVRNADYIQSSTWDKLVFVPAIHDYSTDRLYILSEVHRQLAGKDWDYTARDVKGDIRYDLDVLNEAVDAGDLTEREPMNSSTYGAYYHFGTWNNNHNDVTFSLRFTERGVKNANIATGADYEGSDNDKKKFYIESETNQRTPYGNKKIAPLQGGWIKLNNNVAVLSRTSYLDEIQQAEVFNVERPKPGTVIADATNNAGVSASTVTVIAGVNEISILNAGGKRVTISNLLGQTIAATVLSGNKTTISVPKGIAIVKIDGEKAVKAVVK